VQLNLGTLAFIIEGITQAGDTDRG